MYLGVPEFLRTGEKPWGGKIGKSRFRRFAGFFGPEQKKYKSMHKNFKKGLAKIGNYAMILNVSTRDS